MPRQTAAQRHQEVANEIRSRLNDLNNWLNNYILLRGPDWADVGSGQKVLSDLNDVLAFVESSDSAS